MDLYLCLMRFRDISNLIVDICKYTEKHHRHRFEIHVSMIELEIALNRIGDIHKWKQRYVEIELYIYIH